MPEPSEGLYPSEVLLPGELSLLSGQLTAALEPWQTEDLERLAEAIGAMGFDDLLALIGEEGSEGEPGWVPAWGRLFDVDLCPLEQLPYLGQYVGVSVAAGMSKAEARALVKEEPATKRGSLGAVETAIRKNLTGAKAFTLIERRNAEGVEDGYHFLVSVTPAELLSQAALEEAIRAAKPGGVMFTVTVRDAWLIDESEHTIEADTMTVAETATRRP